MSLDIGRQAYARFFWRIAWLCASLLGMAHTDLTLAEAQLLTHLEVRLIHPDERVRWEQLLCEQHYLHNAQLVGEVLRYGATTPDGQWMALLGWASAALHLRPRDRWLAWSEAQRAARLPLIAQNSRFLLLTERTKFPHLASRALALCTRRLADDWRAAFGHTVLSRRNLCRPRAVCRHLVQSRWLAMPWPDRRLCPRRSRFLSGPGRPETTVGLLAASEGVGLVASRAIARAAGRSTAADAAALPLQKRRTFPRCGSDSTNG